MLKERGAQARLPLQKELLGLVLKGIYLKIVRYTKTIASPMTSPVYHHKLTHLSRQIETDARAKRDALRVVEDRKKLKEMKK